ncbi:hypothetical protein K432DRAFT_301782, partial [Lepidopterella palustris CBS 459.81]
ILKEDARGYPPIYARTREIASLLLRANSNTNPLSYKWVPKFIQWNPRVVSIIGRRI